MNIIVVDDERYILNGEVDLICRTVHGAQVLGFTRSAEALDYVYANPVDVAILDINMPDYNGIDLARRMKIYRPAINIIFATAYSDYFEEAMRLHASGYMLKPLRPERLLEELSDLRHPVAQRGPALYVRTFGDFEVFWHDKPLLFRYQKTKEMFAYLIDRRGAMVESDTLITILWGGEEDRSNYFKQIRKDLKDTLEEIGCGDILIKRRGAIGLLTDKIKCDYFDWLAGTPDGINAYRGEYMHQYSWAESTWVNLEGKSNLWEP